MTTTADQPAALSTAPVRVPPPAEPPASHHPGDGPDQARREELGAFLRNRRERILPEQMGLPAGGRRRTPGLRREEVAQLAGVGVTWYTWLEQGRDINVSDQVLEAVSRTLMFDPHERAHVMTLAGLGELEATRECLGFPPTVQLVLDQMGPYPASVINARHDILAFNRAFAALICDIETLPLEERNTLWLVFTHPAWRAAMVEWEESASRLVAQFRGAMAEHLTDPRWRAMVRRLSEASPDFVRIWERREVLGPENRTKLLLLPDVGLLRLDYTSFWLGRLVGTRMVTYTPVDEVSRAGLETLASRRQS
jgi:transcriptional regulator with XRE-family HTH domain